MAFGIISPGTTPYVTSHNQIRAHVRAYEEDFVAGRVGITLNVNWF